MKPTLVILAAGMASRYGSLKQIQGFGPHGETIMDYSIYDAIRAGFDKVVFIIRRNFADDFKTLFGKKLEGKVKVEYVYQEMQYFTEGYQFSMERTKPWGTAHAVLCASDCVQEPFAVINADDFYGRDAFQVAADFLVNDCTSTNYSIVAYNLKNTISEHGSVNRGICSQDNEGDLLSIKERLNITRQGEMAIADDGLEPKIFPLDTKVSMNFWCLDSSYFAYTQKLFRDFLTQYGQELKSELFIPTVADAFIKDGGTVELLETSSSWFGVTYKEDAPGVQASLNKLIEVGEYPEKLW